MTYELAKKLKEAGFSQIIKIGDQSFNDKGFISYYIGAQEKEIEYEWQIKKPSLSELIEACGDGLWTMRKGLYRGVRGWIVGQDTNGSLNPTEWNMFAFGSTPEEAVANLWLALNEKK